MDELDYDLQACMRYNSLPFAVEDIEEVIAVWEGERDGDDWRWVLKLRKTAAKDGMRFVFVIGGCDYTGWDCQSWATAEYAKTALKAAMFAATNNVPLTGNSPIDAGMGHMLNMLGGNYLQNSNVVYESLVKQIHSHKEETWREKAKKEMKEELKKNNLDWEI